MMVVNSSDRSIYFHPKDTDSDDNHHNHLPPTEGRVVKKSYSRVTRQRKKALFSELQKEIWSLQSSIRTLETLIPPHEVEMILSFLPTNHFEDKIRGLYPLQQRYQIETDLLPTFQTIFYYVRRHFHHTDVIKTIEEEVKKEVRRQLPRLKLELQKLEGPPGEEALASAHASEVENDEEEEIKEKIVGKEEHDENEFDSFDDCLSEDDNNENNKTSTTKKRKRDSLTAITTTTMTATSSKVTKSSPTMNGGRQKPVEFLYYKIKLKNRLYSRASRLKKKMFLEQLKEVVYLLQQSKRFYEMLLFIKSLPVSNNNNNNNNNMNQDYYYYSY